MSTLLVSEIFPPKIGGSGRWFWELYSRLPRRRYLVAAGEDPRQDEVDGATDLRIHRLPLGFPTRFPRPSSAGIYWRALRRLNELVRREEVRTIHAARCLPEGLLALALHEWTGVSYACFAHGEEVNLSNREPRPAWIDRRVYQSRELAWIVGVVLDRARLLIANSDNTRRILTGRWGLPERRVAVLHPGVDTERYSPAPADPEARRRLGWEDRRVLLTVGRLQRRKGHDVLIAALPEIAASIPDVHYAIVGGGEERAALEAAARRHGVAERVQLLGELDDDALLDVYRECDLFVLPNREIDGDIEGFGIVLLEAQACGKPVLAGASGGTEEALDAPRTGLLVPCEHPDGLAAASIELLGDRERLASMGRAARRWVTGRFDWEVRAAEGRRLFEGAGEP